MPCAFRLRRFEREWLRGKPLHLRLMFNFAVRTLEPHWLAPDAGQGRVINVKVKINRLSGLRAPTNEITHRVAPKSQKKRGLLPHSLFRVWSDGRASRPLDH